MLSDYEAAGVRVDDEFGCKLDVFLCNGLIFYLFPALDGISLLLHRLVHDCTGFCELFWVSGSVGTPELHTLYSLVNYNRNSCFIFDLRNCFPARPDCDTY